MIRAAWVPNPRALRAHAIHHDNDGSVPVDVADNDGHGGQSRQLTGVFAAVACVSS